MLRAAVFLLMGLGLFGFGAVAWFSLAPAPSTPVAQAELPAAVAPPVMRPILVAARPVRAGTLLKPDDIAARDVAEADIPSGARMDTPLARAELIGGMVRRLVAAQEALRPSDVMRPGEHGFLAAVLTPGMRAVTVSVDAVSGTAGLIWPGDRVDLILTQQVDERRVFSETVLQDVRVIAIDQQIMPGDMPAAPDSRPARTVTLEVDLPQAERVTVATRLGRLALTVRSAEQAPASARAPSPATTWGADVSPALAQGRGGGSTVRVYGGNTDGKEFRF